MPLTMVLSIALGLAAVYSVWHFIAGETATEAPHTLIWCCGVFTVPVTEFSVAEVFTLPWSIELSQVIQLGFFVGILVYLFWASLRKPSLKYFGSVYLAPLVVVVPIAVVIRLITFEEAYFLDTDSYFYLRLVRTLLKEGELPRIASTAYHPVGQSLRFHPLVVYALADWCRQVSTDPLLVSPLVLCSRFYSPLMASLGAAIIYSWTQQRSSTAPAILAAIVAATSLISVEKMHSSIVELQPATVTLALAVVHAFSSVLRHRRPGDYVIFTYLVILAGLSGRQAVWPQLIVFATTGGIALSPHFTPSIRVAALRASSLTVVAGYGVSRWLNSWGVLHAESLDNSVSLSGLTIVAICGGRCLLDDRRFKKGGLAGQLGISLLALAVVWLLRQADVLSQIAEGAGLTSHFYRTILEEQAPNLVSVRGALGVLDPLLIGSLWPGVVVLTLSLCAVKRAWAMRFMAVSTTIYFAILVSGTLAGVVADIPVSTILLTLFSLAGIGIPLLLKGDANERDRADVLAIGLLWLSAVALGTLKMKYVLHLGLVAPLLVGFLIEQIERLLKPRTSAKPVTVAIIMAVVVSALYFQAYSLSRTRSRLQSQTISEDWQATLRWLGRNTDVSARIWSWWDYGHWITFFGERETLMDPTNVHPEYAEATGAALICDDAASVSKFAEEMKIDYLVVDRAMAGFWSSIVLVAQGCADDPRIEARGFTEVCRCDSCGYFDQQPVREPRVWYLQSRHVDGSSVYFERVAGSRARAIHVDDCGFVQSEAGIYGMVSGSGVPAQFEPRCVVARRQESALRQFEMIDFEEGKSWIVLDSVDSCLGDACRFECSNLRRLIDANQVGTFVLAFESPLGRVRVFRRVGVGEILSSMD